MSLRDGAETIVEQCLGISSGEKVVLVNDGNDQELVDALKEVIEEVAELEYHNYDEPENSGTEPPQYIAEALLDADVFLAPTTKSISHTDAVLNAVENGARGATMPGINKEIWNTSLQADYYRVREICEKIYKELEDGQRVTIRTSSGTDLEFTVEKESFEMDTGLLHNPGDFGNLPAGETHGGVTEGEGTLVIDHFPWAPPGTEVEIEDSRVVEVNDVTAEVSRLTKELKDMECVKNIAEFGFGANPEAKLIGSVLQDEKVLGTVHIAFGDNSHYFSKNHRRHTKCDIHWDAVCESPTVHFGDRKMLDKGEPVFLED